MRPTFRQRKQETLEDDGQSKRGLWLALGVLAIMIAPMLYFNVLRPKDSTGNVEKPLDFQPERNKQVQAPADTKDKKMPEKKEPTKTPPAKEPTATRQGPPPNEPKSKFEEKQAEIRLAAMYSRPGVRWEEAAQDVGQERNHSPSQVREIPAVRNTRNGNGYQNGQSNVWTRDFYERGDDRPGGLQRTSPYVILRGTVIEAQLRDAINTDSPGQIVADITRDVRDSRTGRHVLIPAGSWIVGGYDTRIGDGQQRVPTSWYQLNFPNGTYLPLAEMPGADRSGVAGIPGEVNNHLWARVSSSLLLTLSGAAADVATQNYGGGSGLDFQEAARREGGRQLDQQSRYTWSRGRNRPPTITTEGGAAILVQVTENITSLRPYDDFDNEGEAYAEME